MLFRSGTGPIRADALAASDPGQPKRTVYDGKNLEQVTGEVVRAEGGPAVGDAAADEAFDGLGATYTLWYDVYQRDSIDDNGLPLDAIIQASVIEGDLGRTTGVLVVK